MSKQVIYTTKSGEQWIVQDPRDYHPQSIAADGYSSKEVKDSPAKARVRELFRPLAKSNQ